MCEESRHASYAVEKWHAASGMQIMVVVDHHHISISKIADGPKRNYITPRMQDITSMFYPISEWYFWAWKYDMLAKMQCLCSGGKNKVCMRDHDPWFIPYGYEMDDLVVYIGTLNKGKKFWLNLDIWGKFYEYLYGWQADFRIATRGA
ncbi:hypothetical protein FRACYDRAFT_244317 [Fragilariopsis cylindrus CCMP1102]|uniref:Uncharacterized protein n=1 Tax=Fragilariopsis cylindrus CCMP1102 TaxID=635003 RepID=A0A1E7F1S5_9STRA|nr:hypothetical protein FRACYDRAFT_244317 [Fragilariopsis cylindrus CCMP1102]|eukprot:OEU12077.1 hypothetical protein FRACYDRAFT_244317 [Fragilariopsis cylindrus CCMP1102]